MGKMYKSSNFLWIVAAVFIFAFIVVSYSTPENLSSNVIFGNIPRVSVVRCSDSDGGIKYYLKGTATDASGKKYTDVCTSTNILKEYYCNASKVKYVIYTCAYGCANGTCKHAPTCSDSDGGNTIGVFGAVSGYYNGNTYSYNDYCFNSSSIVEYYCSGVYAQSSQQSCGTDFYGQNFCFNSSVYRDFTDYFCSNGACSHSVTPTFVMYCSYGCSNGTCNPIPDSCSDSDSGSIPETKGTTSGYLSQQYYSNNDVCSNNSTLTEYYCVGDYKQSQELSCGTDNYLINYCVGSGVYHDLIHYYCSDGKCSKTAQPQFVKNCTYGCTNGVCNSQPNQSCTTGMKCKDAYYKAYQYANCSWGASTYCQYGCLNGECKSAPANQTNITCTDPDGNEPGIGQNYGVYTKSTTKGLYWQDHQYAEKTDYCSSGTSISEYYCQSDGYVGIYGITCPYGCYNGACNRSAPVNETSCSTAQCATLVDNCCPTGCASGSDADCCIQAGKYWLQTSWGYGCYSNNYNPGCSPGQVFSNVSDNCCPNWGSAGSDADCCIQAGKYWLQTYWGYSCYPTNYTPCGPGKGECSNVSNDCCPSTCSAVINPDADCCILSGKCWTNNVCSTCT